MAIQSQHGGEGSWHKAMGQRRDSPTVTQHIVSPKSQAVDDGAHGTHDYDAEIHPQVLGHLKAHGSRLDQHQARIERLEAGQQANLGSPLHGEEQKPGGAYPKK